jgi:hypothetical protein
MCCSLSQADMQFLFWKDHVFIMSSSVVSYIQLQFGVATKQVIGIEISIQMK